MSEHAIKIIKIGKEYRLGERIAYNTLRESISKFVQNALFKPKMSNDEKYDLHSIQQNSNSNGGQSTPLYIWPLRDVSFDVKRGEILGIIGRNGAGKSTLLKLISGITEPTEGRIEIYGRIGSLLEVGTGFHQELTGRENIFLNGAILGMKKREIEQKFDEIVDFSGIEKFIDTPVKYYSSGMRVRLGFSVAAHLEPQILLLDEVLAVGDAAFQKKCLGKLDNVATSEGRTVIFVSHDMAAIRSLCERAVLLDNGKVSAIGTTENVVDQYLRSMSLIEEIPLDKRSDIDRSNDKSVIATFLKVENVETGKPIRPSSQIIIKIGYRSKNPVRNMIVQIQIRDYKTNQPITFFDSDNSGGIPEIISGEGTITCVTDKSYMTSGRCIIDLIFLRGTQLIYKLNHAGSFAIEEEVLQGTDDLQRHRGMYLLKHTWSINQ